MWYFQNIGESLQSSLAEEKKTTKKAQPFGKIYSKTVFWAIENKCVSRVSDSA